MDFRKVIKVFIIFVILLAIATGIVIAMKPQMHKMIMFEQIIYKRSTK